MEKLRRYSMKHFKSTGNDRIVEDDRGIFVEYNQAVNILKHETEEVKCIMEINEILLKARSGNAALVNDWNEIVDIVELFIANHHGKTDSVGER